MEVAVEVGRLPHLRVHDPSAMELKLHRFAAINQLLRHQDREPHDEPRPCDTWAVELAGDGCSIT